MKKKRSNFFDYVEDVLECYEWLFGKLLGHGIIGIIIWTILIGLLFYY